MADNDTQKVDAPETDTAAEADGEFGSAFAERAKPEDTEAEEQSSAATDEAASAASDEAPSKEAADDRSGPKAEAFDPYAGMSPELRAHWEKVAASERSQRGRVGALHKKLNTMQSGTQQPSEKQGADDETSQAKEGGEGEQPTPEQKLKAIADGEYGDVVGPLVEVVADLRKELLNEKASKTRDVEIDKDAAELTEAYAELEKQHSDYADIGESPEFLEWVAKQPKPVLDLLQSYDPHEVSRGLTLYKVDSKLASSDAGESSQGKDGNASGERRERQLSGLKQATTRGAPATAGTPNEFNAAFNERAKKAS